MTVRTLAVEFAGVLCGLVERKCGQAEKSACLVTGLADLSGDPWAGSQMVIEYHTSKQFTV